MGKNQYETNLHFVISSFLAMGKNQYETNLHFVISLFLPMGKKQYETNLHFVIISFQLDFEFDLKICDRGQILFLWVLKDDETKSVDYFF